MEKQGGIRLYKTGGSSAYNQRSFKNTKMNSVMLSGSVANDAEVKLVDNFGEETPLVFFTLCDPGAPYQKNDPIFIEVNCMKPYALHIKPYLTKGKPCVVVGKLKSKNYTMKSGETKMKFFIAADYIQFIEREQPISKKEKQ